MRSHSIIKKSIKEHKDDTFKIKDSTYINVLWALGLIPIFNTWLCISYIFRFRPFGTYDPDQITEE